MNFLDFFVYKGKPGIFFAVELGAVCAAALLLMKGPDIDQSLANAFDWTKLNKSE